MSEQAERSCVVVSPVRDESAYLQTTIDSMVSQSVRPSRWIIVDDGSSDNTAEIAMAAAGRYDWIDVRSRSDRGKRKVGGGVVEAFYEGLGDVSLEEFEFVCKLDGDLEFGPDYFRLLFEKFDADETLGTASGKSWLRVGTKLVPERTSDDFSQGQSKLYRSKCFEDIGGFVNEVMWDGIDCHRCRMKGWRARSFRDEKLRFIHLRPMGSSYHSIFHGRKRWGRGQYFMGTHPLYALAVTAYRMMERPFVIGGLCIFLGYLSAWAEGMRRYDDAEFRSFLRKWQLSRLRPF